MKKYLYIDLPNDRIVDDTNLFATATPLSQKMIGWSRYKIEVDLPIHHFKPIADREIKSITLGKEEE